MTAAQAERRLKRMLKRWINVLELDRWDLTIELAPAKDLGDTDGGLAAVADCEPHWEYQRATIRFNAERLRTVDDETLENDVVHELLHCVMAELDTQGRRAKHEERAVTTLTRALLRVAA